MKLENFCDWHRDGRFFGLEVPRLITCPRKLFQKLIKTTVAAVSYRKNDLKLPKKKRRHLKKKDIFKLNFPHR